MRARDIVGREQDSGNEGQQKRNKFREQTETPPVLKQTQTMAAEPTGSEINMWGSWWKS